MARQRDPHRGRCEQAVGPAVFDQVEDGDRVRGVQQGVLRADRQVGQQEDVHLRRVVERQRVHRPVGLLEVQGGDGAQVLVHQGPVGHHRALGQRRGARGVQELYEVLGAGRSGVRRPAGLLRRRATRARLVRRRRPAGAGPVRRPWSRRCHACEQRIVGVAQRQHPHPVRQPGGQRGVGEHQRAPGLLDDVPQVLTGQAVVDGYVHQPGAGAAEKADQVGVGVVAVGRDPPAGLHTGAAQQLGRGRHRLVELPVGPRPVPVAQRHPVGHPPRAAPQHPVDRAASNSRHARTSWSARLDRTRWAVAPSA